MPGWLSCKPMIFYLLLSDCSWCAPSGAGGVLNVSSGLHWAHRFPLLSVSFLVGSRGTDACRLSVRASLPLGLSLEYNEASWSEGGLDRGSRGRTCASSALERS